MPSNPATISATSGCGLAERSRLSTCSISLLRVARLAEDLPEVWELDLNPVCVTPERAVAVDARVRIAPAPDRPDPMLRQLE